MKTFGANILAASATRNPTWTPRRSRALRLDALRRSEPSEQKPSPGQVVLRRALLGPLLDSVQAIATLLRAPVAARDAWHLLWTSTPFLQRGARSPTPLASLNSTVAFVRVKLRRGDDRGPRLPPRPPWRLLTQTEQPRLSLSFQGTERAEGATARRAKLTPR
jgi:hypothetical protein